MTLLEAIEEANTEAGIETFAFANIKEYKSFMDSFEFTDYPVNVVIPFQINGAFDTNTFLANSTASITGFVLRRIPEDTNDWRSHAVESSYLEPMRALAKQFMSKLIQKDVVNSEVQSVTFTIRPEYAFLNAHLFGVGYTLNLPITKNVC